MTTMDFETLERRYRKLLRSYPSGYRRERGEEILTTLMDAAEERGRVRKGESMSLVLRGIRLRLAAGSIPTGLVALIAAVFLAVLGGVAGAVAGWQTAGDLPDGRTAGEIAKTAVPDAGEGMTYDYLFGYEEYIDIPQPMMSFDAMDYHEGYIEYNVEHKSDDNGRLNQARENLTAAGWNVGSVSVAEYGGDFRAVRGDLAVEVSSQAENTFTTVSIERVPPLLVPVLAIAGFALGALAGWVATVWLARRMRQQSPPRRGLVAVVFLIGFALSAPPTLFNLALLGVSLWDISDPVPIWFGYINWIPARLTVAGGAVLAVGLLLAAGFLIRKPKPAPQLAAN